MLYWSRLGTRIVIVTRDLQACYGLPLHRPMLCVALRRVTGNLFNADKMLTLLERSVVFHEMRTSVMEVYE